jgi:hypothetical protein
VLAQKQFYEYRLDLSFSVFTIAEYFLEVVSKLSMKSTKIFLQIVWRRKYFSPESSDFSIFSHFGMEK